MVPNRSNYPGTKRLCETWTGSPHMGALNRGAVYKFRDFRLLIEASLLTHYYK